jgi:hypothetical protein
MLLPETFWDKVNKNGPNGCWVWIAAKSKHGYGRVTIATRCWETHRASYEHYFGPIPGGMCVCHRCDNTLCVNPDHLFLGTVGDNNSDRSSKGRSGRPNTRLDWSTVKMIRADRRSGLSFGKLQVKYGVSQTAIINIVNDVTWTVQ